MIRGEKIITLLAAESPRDKVFFYGWVRQKRESKGIIFLEINDGSIIHNIQVIVEQTIPNYEEIQKSFIGSGVEVTGRLIESPGQGQKYEVHAQSLKILGHSTPEFPLQKKKHSFEFLRTIAHLRPRTNTFGAVFRIRSAAAFAIHEFFQERGFYYIHTPIITGSDCEGAGEMFRVTTLPVESIPMVGGEGEDLKPDFSRDFFKKETSLTVSGQLEAEIFALALSLVYTFGPTFRAENSNTPRHVAEFWMIEPEMAFYDLEDNILLAEEFIKQVVVRVLERCSEDINFLDKWIDKGLRERLEFIVQSAFAVITYSEAVEYLKKANKAFEFPVSWGMDLQTEHERYLTEDLLRKPVFVRDFPLENKAFYMRKNDDDRTVAAMDLLVPGIGEIIGGSQREERYDVLMELISRHGLRSQDYWWYLETRKFGSVPHSGFGLGFARMILFLTGMANIRDVIPFPRTPGNAEF